MYEIILSRKARRFYEKCEFGLARKLNRCFDILANSPHKHPNIKLLKGPLRGIFSYRLGDWRVLYTVSREGKAVYALPIREREARRTSSGEISTDTMNPARRWLRNLLSERLSGAWRNRRRDIRSY